MDYHPFQIHRRGAPYLSAYFATGQPWHFPPLSLSEVPGLSAERASLCGQHAPNHPLWMKSLQPEEGLDANPKITLDSQNLWSEFHKRGTEMVITKSGRYVKGNFLKECQHFSISPAFWCVVANLMASPLPYKLLLQLFHSTKRKTHLKGN